MTQTMKHDLELCNVDYVFSNVKSSQFGAMLYIFEEWVNADDSWPRTFMGPGSIPNNWDDVCGFLKPPGSDRQWKIRLHDAFTIVHGALGIRPTDQSCHQEAWLHLNFVE